MGSTTERLETFPRDRPVTSLILAILACEVVGASGTVFTAMGLTSWYPGLTKPTVAPPNWVFGPVWTALFALMGVAGWLVWRRVPDADSRAARVALLVFAAHFVVNLAWSAVFFGLQSILGGLVVIVLLWIVVLMTIFLFYRVDRRAGALLVPYLAWVGFATYLNYAFWVLN